MPSVANEAGQWAVGCSTRNQGRQVVSMKRQRAAQLRDEQAVAVGYQPTSTTGFASHETCVKCCVLVHRENGSWRTQGTAKAAAESKPPATATNLATSPNEGLGWTAPSVEARPIVGPAPARRAGLLCFHPAPSARSPFPGVTYGRPRAGPGPMCGRCVAGWLAAEAHYIGAQITKIKSRWRLHLGASPWCWCCWAA